MIYRMPLIAGHGKFSPAQMQPLKAGRFFPGAGIGIGRAPLVFQATGIGRVVSPVVFSPTGIVEYPERQDTISLSPTEIINLFSSGGVSIPNAAANYVGKQTLSGVLAAGVFSTVLSLAGPGVLSVLTVSSVDATARQVGCRVTIDGDVAFNAVSDSIAAAGRGMVVIGSWIAANVIAPQFVAFARTLTVEVSSDLNETNLVEVRAAYWT